MAKKPSAKSKAQKRKQSPAHLIIKPRSARTTPEKLKEIQKKKRENGCLGKTIFPSSLGTVLKALKGDIFKAESLH
jgi:hypothetical protein